MFWSNMFINNVYRSTTANCVHPTRVTEPLPETRAICSHLVRVLVRVITDLTAIPLKHEKQNDESTIYNIQQIS